VLIFGIDIAATRWFFGTIWARHSTSTKAEIIWMWMI